MPTYNAGYRDDQLIHIRKTVAFTGGVGLGAQGTVALFTTTGVVMLKEMSIRCTETLVTVNGTFVMGTTNNTSSILGSVTPANIVTGNILSDIDLTGSAGSGAAASAGYNALGAYGELITNESVLLTISTAAVSDGTLIFDCWWKPVSADGALVAA